jgi:hypothetical protein
MTLRGLYYCLYRQQEAVVVWVMSNE